MSANYREHQLERDLKRRVASLEARVVWLEDVLARVLGQPAANEAGETPLPVISLAAAPASLDRFLLRTQPMSALARSPAVSVHGELETPAANGPAGFDAFLLPLESAENAPAAIAPAAPSMFTAADLAPGPTVPRTAAAVNLGITAAFETLEGKVAEAAVAELASVRKRAPAAPAIAISLEMIDAPPAPPRRLDVRCALEVLNPGILQQVTAIWRNAECAARLHRLIDEDQGGRMGLDPLVREELQLLRAISASRAA